jgi:hypothetical protein
MVSTVKPKARATPAKPIPSSGNAAASIALPHPPKVNQNVPRNSAAIFFCKPTPPNANAIRLMDPAATVASGVNRLVSDFSG